MDYNATTSLEPEVIDAITEALRDAWGNPSSNYIAGEEYHLFKLVFSLPVENAKPTFT